VWCGKVWGGGCECVFCFINGKGVKV